MTEAVSTPIEPTKDPEKDKLWTDWQMSAYELGQLTQHVHQIEKQLTDLQEKQKAALRRACQAADKHDKYVNQQKTGEYKTPEVVQ